MNHQYMQQQQQQQQQQHQHQQPGYHPGHPGSTPLYQPSASDIPQNASKQPGAPASMLPNYTSQKPIQGPLPPANSQPPPPMHPPYYNNNTLAGNIQTGAPPPPQQQQQPQLQPQPPQSSDRAALTSRMADMSLTKQQHGPPSVSLAAPPTGSQPVAGTNNSNFTLGAARPNVNGYDAPSNRSPLDSTGQNETQAVTAMAPPPTQPPSSILGGSQMPGQPIRGSWTNQQIPPQMQQQQDNAALSRHANDIVGQQQYPPGGGMYPPPPPPPPSTSQLQSRPPPPPPAPSSSSSMMMSGYSSASTGQQQQRGPPTTAYGGQQPQQQQQPGGPIVPPGPPMQRQQQQYMSGPPMAGQPPIGSSPLNQQPHPPLFASPPGFPQQQQQPYPDPYIGQRTGPAVGGPYQGTMQHQQQQQQQARRLDPDQMPSPIQVMQDDERSRGGVFVTNQKGLVPPLVTTKYTVQDQGNASPRFIRSTMYTVPTTNDMMKQTGVPFGLILSPMAQVAEGEYEPPIVDMGEIGPVRCIRCKAYMSPFMQFIDAGRRFQCAFCRATSQVPQEYFQHLDHTGQRMDLYERPELVLGTYEYTATADYCRNNVLPKPPAIIFLIDVSYNNVKSGLVALICAEMKRIIAELPIDAGQDRTRMKVGFITYNNTVHFYNVNACLTQPQMMVVGDVQDVFMPLLDGFLCDPEESEIVIDALMAQIPAMFADTRETETILAPAIQAGLEALKASDRAGKLMVFHSSLPIAEAPGKLKNRDDRKVLGTDKEKTVLAPQTNVYNNLGQECVAAGCSVDLFIFNNSYVDVATISQICRLTGGEVYKYTYFQADTEGERLITDIVNNISRPIAFDAVMRVRTSTGVRATDFYGHFFMSNTTDMELASMDCNKAVAIEIKHDDKLTDDEGVYVQAALLYTSCGGVRRLRIINLGLRTSSQMAELYRACDLDAIINFFSKQSVAKLIESSPKSVKDALVARCATILAAYRKHCASPSSAGQLILPECMKLLPLYVNCLLKSDAISGGADMTIDDRSYVMQAVSTMPLYTSVIYFYPRLLPLHSIDPQSNKLPQQLRCSFDKFMDDGAYLLENGIHMFLWLGLGLSSEWVTQVFGVTLVDTDRTTLPVLDTLLNKRVRETIAQVRAERHHCMRLTIVRQREKLEMVLRQFLVEDRGNDGSPSYVDFLCHMHKEIKTLLSQ